MGCSGSKDELQSKVDKMWAEIGSSGQVERLACWGLILADAELAELVGKGDKAKGKAMLESMKAVKALDISGDGIIDESEFRRLYDPAVLAAAEAQASLPAKVDKMWAEVGKSGQVERLACWDFILADAELAKLVGKGDAAKGKMMLESMKTAKALDISGDGIIDESEFLRLFDPTVLSAAENDTALKTKVHKMWAEVGKSGQVERLACWDFILADAELASIMGKGNEAKGKTMLLSMKAAKALDISGDSIIDESEFQRLYNPAVLAAAQKRPSAA